MKKINTTKLMALLASACLITSSFVGSTLAKYTTTANADDTARVAKWGVVVSATGSLYGAKYASDDSKITASEDTDVVSVLGKQYVDNNNVVAPGTKSDEGFHFDINGNPEVDTLTTVQMEHQNIFLAKGNYGVMVEVVDVTEDNFPTTGFYTKNGDNYTLVNAWDATVGNWYALHDAAEVTNEKGYWPVVYTMTGETSHTGDVNDDTLKAIADKIAANFTDNTSSVQDTTNTSKWKFEDIKRNIEQNEDLSDVLKLGDIAITWEWAFDGVNDGADTILGNLMAERIGTNFAGDVVKSTGTNTFGQLTEGTDYCLDTNFSIELTVEQTN